MLTDAVISSSFEPMLDFVILCVYIQRYHVGKILFYRKTYLIILMLAINRRMLTDAVISSSSESILDFVIHVLCVYIQRYHVGNYCFTEKSIRLVWICSIWP